MIKSCLIFNNYRLINGYNEKERNQHSINKIMLDNNDCVVKCCVLCALHRQLYVFSTKKNCTFKVLHHVFVVKKIISEN